MKKITLKISAFLLLAISALQVNAQACPEIYTEDASYLISTCGETTELYMTIDGTTGDEELLVLVVLETMHCLLSH